MKRKIKPLKNLEEFKDFLRTKKLVEKILKVEEYTVAPRLKKRSRL
jgi:hypothetical protein